MKIKAVGFEGEQRAFMVVPWLIHADDAHWIPPLEREINRIFNPQENPLFKLGTAKRWVVWEGSRLIGRIAAFDHPKYLGGSGCHVGGIGFFDCFYNHKAANLLFDTALKWLKARGIEYVEGPINFGEKDRFWGLLTEGFTEPAYGMNYNPPYYQVLMEAYGFQPYYRQYIYERHLSTPLPDPVYSKARAVLEDAHYHFEPMPDGKQATLETYAKAFQQVYNREWEHKKGFNFITFQQAMTIFRTLKAVLIPDLVWFAYHRSRPVAFFIMVPDLNQVFKHFKGRFGWWERLKLRYHQWLGGPRKTFGLTIGIDADHQDQGVEAALMLKARSHMLALDRWDTIEMTWIGDFNPQMIRMVESLGSRHVKTHVTYCLSLSA